ncbi:MAG: 23S rRNA (uracil(1939)-C(5))-methyltransferase RlmD [Verrucomicrobia bacterium]|nr:23S rRNA (uracil(1939)-C(5))-methyltransferase RlmD [Verrucomicrobiota bacterium]
MNSSPFPEIELQIERLSRKGRGVGIYRKAPPSSDTQVDVVGGIPGDTLRVQIGPKRKGKAQGMIREVIAPSALRVDPRCVHVPECGGCAFQAMDYAAQLKEKQSFVEKLFTPLITAQTQTRPIISCESPWRYRNKMEFSFSQNRAGERFFGLMIAGSKGKVLNLSECHLVNPWFIDVLTHVRAWWEKSGLDAYRMNDTGSLRTLIVREGIRTGDKMAMLTVSGNPDFALKQPQLQGFIEAVKLAVPQEQHERLSIFLRIQQLKKGSPTQFFEMHLHGPDHIAEKLNIDTGSRLAELQFKISPTSFFQPNTLQAEKLYSAALKLVSTKRRHVLDLYAGTATLGLAMALQSDLVTSIELNPHALFDAQSNQEVNGISNLRLICGDVGKVLAEQMGSPNFIPPDLVIVDPPRPGLDPAAISHILSLKPQQVLYISCNPLTQVANVQEIVNAGYTLEVIQPVDQFPHTVHIENIVLLNRL